MVEFSHVLEGPAWFWCFTVSCEQISPYMKYNASGFLLSGTSVERPSAVEARIPSKESQ